MATIEANSVLTAAGNVLVLKANEMQSVELEVADNGNASTFTIETAPDGSTWTANTVIGYALNSGQPVALGASTFTAKGRYLFDLTQNAYIRIRVSTFVSGVVATSFEESAATLRSVLTMLQTNLTASGTTQAAALPLQALVNVFTTVAASQSCRLPDSVPRGTEIIIRNQGASALSVFPSVGGTINALAANASLSVAAAGSARLVSDGAGKWYQF